ncbi:hypothetical protein [Sulfitobacter geojensis]|uniref:Lipoprotein n=1 Tax=Sulfitobacter geojensis TaxID=1342299 RepID=A0AAE3B8H7_9RHOB|nr:hypothetical protein [Sulfitobacter geojensis]MBM1690658.1 hypothetical protein [Sulfitobacter geojensis]MBM1694724.1 hypothetical protein [Sulfitobacter geojensis]MBM1707570.1 hypothetical protein [Sulfitobacter geojensis]MBM1711180.1 hypothetical protein [Sulfitobacter geojensis]MBM1715695.1 hypothetical protein [Sulfitobacter geojensis]
MHKIGVSLGFLLVLSACGDPLSGVMRISDVDLVENDPTAQALPSDAEVAREGFFGTQAANPVEGTESSDTTLAQTATGAAPVVSEPAPQGGLFGLLRRAVPAQRPVAGGAEDTLSADAFEAAKSAEAVAAEPTTQLAAVSPEPEAPASAPERRGFFARLGSKSAAKATESELPEVDYGTMLPYGVMARSCAAKRQPLGRKVDAVSASGYTLYDSNPAASGTRIFYITGFDDGCPRQVTAAHVLLGEPSFYEQLHYGPAGQHLTFGETDRAYEKVKGSVCGVRKGKPCGAKMKKLEREAVFINAYERLSDNKRWSEQLIHDGTVVASEMKSSG